MAVNINVPSQVRTFANLAAFPASGAVKTIYIAEDTNKTYRWDGSTYVEISATAATSLTIGTTPIASGTVGRVLFEGTGNVLQESANLFWDNTNGRLGIGTSSPTDKLHVLGGNTNIFKIQSNVANLFNQFVSTDGTGEYGIFNDAFYFQPLTTLANGLRFLNGANAVVLQMSQVGNIQINTTTDAGFKLDVNGTARVTTSLAVGVLGTDGYIYLNRASTGGNVGGIRAQGSGSEIGGGGFLDRILCSNGAGLYFYTWTGSGSVSTQRMQLFGTSGNLLIQNGGTFTDAGYKLDVNGTARFKDSGSAASIIMQYGTGGWIAVSNSGGTEAIRLRGGGGPSYFNTGQNVLIGTTTDIASSLVTMESTTKGFLPPRMTTTQRNAIASPAAGLIVYDTTLNLPHFFNGTIWVSL